MPQVTVTISGRQYRMACADGEEPHLESLAAYLDAKIEEMRASFGEIGDMRLQVMAGLTIADEVSDLKKRIGALEQQLAGLQSIALAGDERSNALESRITGDILRAADRIERLARSLNTSAVAQA
jgi:cell division protein ZapA